MKKLIFLFFMLLFIGSLFSCTIKHQDMQQQAFPIVSENNNNEKKQENQTDTIVEQPTTPEQNNVKSDQQQAEPPIEEKQEEKPNEDDAQSNLNEKSENEADKEEITHTESSGEETGGNIDYGTIKINPKSFHVIVNDIFIGEVISKEKAENCPDFENIGTKNSEVEMCTVKVIKSLYSRFTQEETVIRVPRLVNPKGTEAFEVGKTYIMSTILQPYDEKPVCVDAGFLSAEVLENNELRANSSHSKDALENIKTIDSFITNFVMEMKKSKEEMKLNEKIYFNSDWYKWIPTTEKEELTEQEVIDYLKEAIKIDSDKVLKTPETVE